MTTTRYLPAAVTALLSTAACGLSDAPADLGAGELQDLGVEVPAYAVALGTTVRTCPILSDGSCDPGAEESWFTVDITAAVDVSVDPPIVQPCSIAGYGETRNLEYDDELVRQLPSGDARAGVNADGTVDLRLALSLGVELADPFEDPFPTSGGDARVADHDGDGKEGMTYETGTLGRDIQFGARVVFDVFSVDPAQPAMEAEAGLGALDYAIYGDNIPFVNVAKKVRKFFEDNKQSGTDSSALLIGIDEAGCAAVDGVL